MILLVYLLILAWVVAVASIGVYGYARGLHTPHVAKLTLAVRQRRHRPRYRPRHGIVR